MVSINVIPVLDAISSAEADNEPSNAISNTSALSIILTFIAFMHC